MPKYPDIKVEIELASPEGNAYYIINKVINSMKLHKANQIDVLKFTRLTIKEAKSYEEVLDRCKEYVNIKFL